MIIAASTELASSSLADNPGLHAVLVAALLAIALAVYLVRRRRRKVDGDLDGDDYGTGSHGPTHPGGHA